MFLIIKFNFCICAPRVFYINVSSKLDTCSVWFLLAVFFFYNAVQVLSVVLRLNGHHFAAPTQLLPAGGDPNEVEMALETFTEALKAATDTPQGSKVKIPKGSFDWKEYRQATKAVLAGLANSLRNVFPAGWSLKASMPPNLLQPVARGCDRVALVEAEKEMFGQASVLNLSFNYDYNSYQATPQWYLHENFHRLIFSADEGTEAWNFFQRSQISRTPPLL